LAATPGHGQENTSEQPADAVDTGLNAIADEFERVTPRRSLRGFLVAAQARDFERAAEYLDLRNLPARMNPVDGPSLAQRLAIVIERELWIDLDEISDFPEGASGDELPSYRDEFAEIELGGKVITLLLQRVPRGDEEFIWKVSNKTVVRIPELYAEFGYGPVAERLIRILPDVTFLNVELFKWVITIGTGLVAYPLLLMLLRFASGLIAKESSPVHILVKRFLTRPFLWLLMAIIINQVLYSLGLGIEAQRLANAQTVNITIVTWVLLSATNLVRAIYGNRLLSKGSEGAVVLLGPISNAAKVIIVIFALLLWLNNLGFSITALLAGLGVGGIAIALALQKPLEDLLGAVSLYSQKHVKVGDFCKIGNILGTIEEIGLRTTRVRTLDNTVVSIPNSKIAGDILDNYSARQRIWYHPKLTLRYGSTTEQLKQVLSATRDLAI
jgi:MscS family membrane protein